MTILLIFYVVLIVLFVFRPPRNEFVSGSSTITGNLYENQGMSYRILYPEPRMTGTYVIYDYYAEPSSYQSCMSDHTYVSSEEEVQILLENGIDFH
jgi:hypothetical protein